MAVAVEHDKRRKKILEKALTIFMDDGFEDATFQKIADRCGITRTILYLYFKNKKEIFTYSIKQLLLSLEEKINLITSDKSLGSVEKITKVLFAIFKQMEQNRQLLSVILDYLLHLSKSDVDTERRVRRRTLKLRHILLSMLIEGMKTGELKKTNIKLAADYLNSFVETGIYQIVVLRRDKLDDLRETVTFAVKQFANPDYA